MILKKTQPDLFEKGQQLKRSGQRQAASAVPFFARQAVSSAFRMLARQGEPFTFSPTVEGHPNLWELLPPATQELVAQHRNYLGAIASVQSGNKFIVCCGWATTLQENAHGRPCRVWRIAEGK